MAKDCAVMALCFLGISLAFWIIAAFIQWRDDDGHKSGFFCYHDLTDDNGSMGDAVKCSKCGLFTYDGFNSHLWLYRLLGRVNRKRPKSKKHGKL